MTTDLRAALRDRLAAAFDAAWEATGEGFNGEYTRRSFTSEMYERMRAEHIDKILADAPPTVAELLPRVDVGHEVHWTGSDGKYRAVLDDSLQFYWLGVDEDDDWIPGCVMPSDLTQPGLLVEVTP